MDIRYGEDSSEERIIAKLNNGLGNGINFAVFESLRTLLSHHRSHDRMIARNGLRADEIFDCGYIHIVELGGRYELVANFRSGYQADRFMWGGPSDPSKEAEFVARHKGFTLGLEDFLIPKLSLDIVRRE